MRFNPSESASARRSRPSVPRPYGYTCVCAPSCHAWVRANCAITSTPAGTPPAGRPGPGRARGRWPGPTGPIHHSDRGSQYASDAYRTALNQAKLRCSTTDGYDCYQNALAERVNGILKNEFLFVLPDDLAQALLPADQAVHLCNEERPHLALHLFNPQSSPPARKKPRREVRAGPLPDSCQQTAGRDKCVSPK